MFEMTIQSRVTDFPKGLQWYQQFFQRVPDFAPHEGNAEWEIIPGCWLQLAEGSPAEGSGPLRVGVSNIKEERKRIMKKLDVPFFEIYSREEVPVKWGTFTDPWGNRLGFFEYLDKSEEKDRIQTILKASM